MVVSTRKENVVRVADLSKVPCQGYSRLGSLPLSSTRWVLLIPTHTHRSLSFSFPISLTPVIILASFLPDSSPRQHRQDSFHDA